MGIILLLEGVGIGGGVSGCSRGGGCNCPRRGYLVVIPGGGI